MFKKEAKEKKTKMAKFPQKKIILVGLVLIGVIGVVGVFVYFWRSKTLRITNFQECIQAGYPVMESLPRQCRTQEGEIFVEKVEGEEGQEGLEGEEEEKICEDLCGDGICQEVVCLGSGCPCAETLESCPEDCPSGNTD